MINGIKISGETTENSNKQKFKVELKKNKNIDGI